ncbi:hemolysin [Paracoccus alkanivorans]|uniref:Hemolysin n=2 Tax=Paracoccus alkanivorans TaxID=2116655 RepID=A0A3M0M1Q4_9RHOB|nr:hemolysin [Paracoccus alkanivorans]
MLSYDYNSQDLFGYEFDITSRPIASINIRSIPELERDGFSYIYGDQYDNETFAACFAPGTLIATREGERAVETLAVGDLVYTRDCGLQRIRWIGSRLFTAEDLRSSPNLRPIRIRKGSLGKDIPSRDLVVSPQHRILLRNRVAKRMFGGAEVLVAAKHLMEIHGVSLAEDMEEVEYFHIMFGRHQLVYSNGAETESMYAGKMAMKAVPREQAEEIFAIFPELRDVTMKDFPAPARLLVPERRARQLAARIRKNEHVGGFEPPVLPQVQDRRG